MTIRFDIRKIRFVLGAVTALLLAASFFVGYEKYILGNERLFGLVRLFSLDGEQNFPTWYQSGCLLTAGILAWFVSNGEKAAGAKYVRHWQGLAVILTAMSVDEFASFHELIGDEVLVHKMSATADKFHSLWLFVAVPFVLVFAFAYFKFLFAMPAADRKRFILAGALYLTGVVVIETIGGFLGAQIGEESWKFSIVANFEETFEMLGQLTLIVALLRWIERRSGSVQIEVR